MTLNQVIPTPKGQDQKSRSAEITLPCVDEELSHSPFFQAYRYSDEPTMATSLQRAIATVPEVPIAKLFAYDLMSNPCLIVFTNHGVIVLYINRRFWRALWKLTKLLELIPILKEGLGLLITPLKALVDKVLKTNYKFAKRLTSLPDKTILEIVNLRKKNNKIANGVRGSWKPYPEKLKELQPSLGVSIQYKMYSFALSKFGVSTIRVLPLGRFLEVASSAGGAAEYTLPDNKVIPKINELIQALPNNIPVDHKTSGPHEVRLHWPEKIGVGKNRWSMYAAAIVTLLIFSIFCIFVLVGVSGEEIAFLLAIPVGLCAVNSLIRGRSLVYALIYGLFPALGMTFLFANKLGLFD